MELRGSTLVTCEFGSFSDVHCLKNFDQVVYMKFPNNDANEWIAAIQTQIAAMNAKFAEEKNVKQQLHLGKFVSNSGSDNSATIAEERTVNGVNIHSLGELVQGPRSKFIYKFLVKEIKFMDTLAFLNAVLVQPLIDASKGAVLNAVKVAISSLTGEITVLASQSQDALFTKPLFATTKAQAGAVAEMLHDPDVQIFLRAAEILASSSKEQVKHLESYCSAGKWSEDISLVSFFNAVSTKTFFGHLKSYASGLQAIVRILNHNLLAEFRGHCEKTLQSAQSCMKEKIELPRNRLKVYNEFLKGLIDITPSAFPDLAEIRDIVQSLEALDMEIDEMIMSKMHFEKLLSIQQCFTVFVSDPIVQKIATMDRKFVKEGVLKKVCRKQNKSFMFWLFSDIIMYGTSLGNDTFSFNRAMDLRQIVVAEHKSSSTANAFEILGAEKSFVVIAVSTDERREWMDAIKSTKEALCAASTISSAAATVDVVEEVAPIWVSDGKVDGCAVCQASFTFFIRRHHCRKCGDVVCAEHSKGKEILPHIHKTQKQRICDNCMKVKTNWRMSLRSDGGESSKTRVASTASIVSNDDNDEHQSKSPHLLYSTEEAVPDPTALSSALPASSSELVPALSSAPVSAPPKKPPKVKPALVHTTEKENDLPEQIEKSLTLQLPPAIPSLPPPIPSLPPPTLSSPPPLPVSKPPPLPSSPPPPLPTSSAPPLSPPPVPPSSPPTVIHSPVTEETEQLTKPLSVLPIKDTPVGVDKPVVSPRFDSPPPPITVPPPTIASPPPVAVPPILSPGNQFAKSPAPHDKVSTSVPERTEISEDNLPVSTPSRIVANAATVPPPAPSPPPVASPSRPPPPPAPPIGSSNKVGSNSLPFPPVSPPPPPAAAVHVIGSATASPRPPPPPPPASSISATPILSSTPFAAPPPPPPPSTTSDAKPRPPPPPQPNPPIQPLEEASGIEDPLKKYRKMKDMLPEGAVRQKMKSDGFLDSEITAFLAGKAISMPSAQELEDRQSQSVSAPKPFVLSPSSAPKTKAAEVKAPPPPRRLSVLDEIQMGPKLKPVDPNDKRQKPKAEGKAIGLLGALAAAMSERRINIKVEQEDDDSDASGWSDADSD